MKDYLLIF